MTFPPLPAEEILSRPALGDSELARRGARPIGVSREGREILAVRVGSGGHRVSLLGGCHADEPVGPESLSRLSGFLLELEGRHPLLTELRWSIVPHVNPDGRERNRIWSRQRLETADCRGLPDQAFDLAAYLGGVVRETPGDDVEFGFPRDEADRTARPENLAVAAFLKAAKPYHLHGSFHGMGLAPGPWFLLESAWVSRTLALRRSLRRLVRELGLGPLDIDRGGEKGFHRIDEGFATRPDSQAMRQYFLERGDPATAARFRPSSMEFVRALGGDPLTFVTEMPLFVLDELDKPLAATRRDLEAAAGEGRGELERLAAELGIRPLPIRDQARLQIAFLNEALRAVTGR